MRGEGREREEEGDDERGGEPGRRGQGEIGGERIRLSVIVSRCRTRGNSLTAEGRRQRGEEKKSSGGWVQSQLRGRWRDTEWRERGKNGPKKEGRQNDKLSGHHSRRTWFVTLNKTQRQD